MINEHAQASFNQRAAELIQKLVTKKIEKSGPSELKGSDAEIYSLDWSDKWDSSRDVISQTYNRLTGDRTDIFLSNNEGEIGFEGETYNQFIGLAKSIYKLPTMNQSVSDSFVESTLFEWVTNAFKKAKIEQEFCNYLIDKAASVSEDWTVAFTVLYLRIPCKLTIGETWFDYTKKQEIEDYIEGTGKKTEEEKEATRKIYGNTVYVACSVKNCSRERARELAFEKCSLSVDILKCLLPTVQIPDVKLQFDIDSRTKKNEKNQTFVFKDSFFDKVSISLNPSVGEPFNFPESFEPVLNSHIFQTLLDSNVASNELQDVVKMNIKKLAAALSNENLYERIVLIASIWDSIFLSNENEPVLYTITRYGPKLIDNSVNGRKAIKGIVKKMYRCRSAYIHRAREVDFEVKELGDFQMCTLVLLSNLTHLSFFYESTEKVMEVIDDDIEAAFDMTEYVHPIPKTR